ncbi:MAG: hypothetical protein M1840_008482 [Geoglossum simile]|nr:MAG: hypothetical protein M1840_008482 [Geoglossum simile]
MANLPDSPATIMSAGDEPLDVEKHPEYFYKYTKKNFSLCQARGEKTGDPRSFKIIDETWCQEATELSEMGDKRREYSFVISRKTDMQLVLRLDLYEIITYHKTGLVDLDVLLGALSPLLNTLEEFLKHLQDGQYINKLGDVNLFADISNSPSFITGNEEDN